MDLSGAHVVPLAGGYSGETFLVSTVAEQAVLRLYARRPDRAAVDLALLERVRGLVPVPQVLDAVTLGDATRPPFLLLESLPGDRLDLVLPAADPALAERLGRAVAGMLVLLATVRFGRPGSFADPGLQPEPFRGPAADVVSWLDAHADRAWFAGLPPAEFAALRVVAEHARELIDGVGHVALVHGDLNPKNLLVDPATGGVTGVLDWEFAYAGSPLADVGNLLRHADDPDYAAFAAAVVDTYGSWAPGVPADWLETARALDLFALIDLAGQERPAPPVEGARAVLAATARSGDLAAGRPDWTA